MSIGKPEMIYLHAKRYGFYQLSLRMIVVKYSLMLIIPAVAFS